MFLENWKRLQMRLCYFWDLTGLEEEEVSSVSSCYLLLVKNIKRSLDQDQFNFLDATVIIVIRNYFHIFSELGHTLTTVLTGFGCISSLKIFIFPTIYIENISKDKHFASLSTLHLLPSAEDGGATFFWNYER